MGQEQPSDKLKKMMEELSKPLDGDKQYKRGQFYANPDRYGVTVYQIIQDEITGLFGLTIMFIETDNTRPYNNDPEEYQGRLFHFNGAVPWLTFPKLAIAMKEYGFKLVKINFHIGD